MSDTHVEQGGLTRREVLKRGAILGGALVWTTPMVQTLGMQSALAQTVSDVCQLTVSLAVEDPDPDADGVIEVGESSNIICTGTNTGDRVLTGLIFTLTIEDPDGDVTGPFDVPQNVTLDPGEFTDKETNNDWDESGEWTLTLSATALCDHDGDSSTDPVPISSINTAVLKVTVT